MLLPIFLIKRLSFVKCLGNHNATIAKNMSTITRIEGENSESTAMLNKKLVLRLHHVKSLEQRLKDIEDQNWRGGVIRLDAVGNLTQLATELF